MKRKKTAQTHIFALLMFLLLLYSCLCFYVTCDYICMRGYQISTFEYEVIMNCLSKRLWSFYLLICINVCICHCIYLFPSWYRANYVSSYNNLMNFLNIVLSLYIQILWVMQLLIFCIISLIYVLLKYFLSTCIWYNAHNYHQLLYLK